MQMQELELEPELEPEFEPELAQAQEQVQRTPGAQAMLLVMVPATAARLEQRPAGSKEVILALMTQALILEQGPPRLVQALARPERARGLHLRQLVLAPVKRALVKPLQAQGQMASGGQHERLLNRFCRMTIGQIRF
jgi:hypothetical protein